MDRTTTHDRDPVALLQRLISFDTLWPATLLVPT